MFQQNNFFSFSNTLTTVYDNDSIYFLLLELLNNLFYLEKFVYNNYKCLLFILVTLIITKQTVFDVKVHLHYNSNCCNHDCIHKLTFNECLTAHIWYYTQTQ